MPQHLNRVEVRSLTGLLQKVFVCFFCWSHSVGHLLFCVGPLSCCTSHPLLSCIWWTDHLRYSSRHISQLGWSSDEGVPCHSTSTQCCCGTSNVQRCFHPQTTFLSHVLFIYGRSTKMLVRASEICKASTLGFLFTAVSLLRCSFVLWYGPHGAHQATLLELQTQLWCVFFIGQVSFN